MSIATTFLFNKIFPTFDSWKSYTSSIKTLDNLDQKYNEYLYNILINHFGTQNIRYITIESFLQELSLVITNSFEAFRKTKEIIDAVYQITLKDYILINQAISNIANNPNDENDPTKPLGFISNQTYNLLEDNKLKGYLSALESTPNLQIRIIVNEYKYLFMVIQPNDIYIYYQD